MTAKEWFIEILALVLWPFVIVFMDYEDDEEEDEDS